MGISRSRRLLCLAGVLVSRTLLAQGPDFPVDRYGAVADGRTDCSSSIQAAIDAAARAGGGRVVLPPSKQPYLLRGGLRIEGSGIELYGPGAGLLLADHAASATSPPLLLISGEADRPIRRITLRGFTVDANYYQQPKTRSAKGVLFHFAEDVLVEDLRITRPYVGLSFRQGCHRAVARRVTITDYQEDAFDAGGDADEIPDGLARHITFVDVVARDAPHQAFDGNAFEIEDGARDVRIENALVENVAGNGIALRNHQSKSIPNHSGPVTVIRSRIQGVGGAYAIFGRSAPSPLDSQNTYRGMTLTENTVDGLVAFWGPIRGLTIQGGAYRSMLLGFETTDSPRDPAQALHDVVVDRVSAESIRVNAQAASLLSIGP